MNIKLRNRTRASVKREISVLDADGNELVSCSGPLAEEVIAMIAYQLTTGEPTK
jgi:hypothetical protein